MTREKFKILIADDEADIRKILRLLFEKKGYAVEEAANGDEAVMLAKNSDLDLIVMDIMMPKLSGVDATAAIREFSTVPILFLTAKSLDSDKESAYLSGGDDYLVKPFSSLELLLKAESMMRRYTVYRGKEDRGGYIKLVGGIEVNTNTKTVAKRGEEVILRDKESDIFFCLLQNRGSTLTTEVIYETVWQEMAMSTSSNNVMVNIVNLRKKLEDNPSTPKLIKTVWGKGYRLD